LLYSNAPTERVSSHVKLVKKPYQSHQKAKTTDAMKTGFWLLYEEKRASKIIFPMELILKTQQVKASLPVKSH
jgi:hypothetical protein